MTSSARGAATPRLLRRLNANLVLDALRSAGPLRVTDLVARTHLSRPTVDAVADDLLRLGWLEQVGAAPGAGPRRGRPARLLAFRADAGYVVGVDIGEHTVRVAVADLLGRVVAERRHGLAAHRRGTGPPTVPHGSERLELVRRTAAATLADAGVGRDAVLAASVGCTGGMDAETGAVLFTSAFPGLADVNLRTALTGTLGDTVLVENECNLAVLGERWQGAAVGVEDAICVLAAERLGAGIVVGGTLVRGHAGLAGEMPFLGAYEFVHGAEGIAYLIRTLGTEAAAAGRLAGLEPAGLEAETVVAAARAGDPVAIEIVERSRARGGARDRRHGARAQPRARGDRRRGGGRRRRRARPAAAPARGDGAHAAAAGGVGARGRAARSSARSATRSTTSSRRCWPGSRTWPELRVGREVLEQQARVIGAEHLAQERELGVEATGVDAPHEVVGALLGGRVAQVVGRRLADHALERGPRHAELAGSPVQGGENVVVGDRHDHSEPVSARGGRGVRALSGIAPMIRAGVRRSYGDDGSSDERRTGRRGGASDVPAPRSHAPVLDQPRLA